MLYGGKTDEKVNTIDTNIDFNAHFSYRLQFI